MYAGQYVRTALLTRIFIGYDHAEAIAFHTLSSSIHMKASQPVSITPLMTNQLKGLLTRERHPLQTNAFSFSRFLVPYLSGYEGWSLFMDCDMICTTDICELFSLKDDYYSVQVVKHCHVPEETEKYLGRPQTRYEKKNWSSVMLFNNASCEALTPEYVNAASGLDLHQFKWLRDDGLIGELPKEWNHLVGYDQENPHAKIVHYTIGGPYFNEYRGCEYSDEWFHERNNMQNCEQRQTQHYSRVRYESMP